MSKSNGVLRIKRKGIKKFAFGEEGSPDDKVFEVDVMTVFQEWLVIDDQFREDDPAKPGERTIPLVSGQAYNLAATSFVEQVSGVAVTVTEAFEFIARLREAYEELAAFFQVKLPGERSSPSTSEGASGNTLPKTEIQFLTEPG